MALAGALAIPAVMADEGDDATSTPQPEDGNCWRGLGLRGGPIAGGTQLADALGITVDELQAAMDEAHAARLAQAVENGRITQEQADMMQARHDLRSYLNQDEIRDAIRSIYKDAVQQAVTDGVITQEQADSILSEGPRGLGGMHGGFADKRVGFGCMRGQFGGMHPGFGMPGPGQSDSSATTATGYL